MLTIIALFVAVIILASIGAAALAKSGGTIQGMAFVAAGQVVQLTKIAVITAAVAGTASFVVISLRLT